MGTSVVIAKRLTMAPSVTPERDLDSGAAGGGVGGSETMLAAKTLGLRKDFDMNSAELPAKLLAGTVVTVHETRTMPDGSKRARITSLDGKIAGIITSISKEGAAGLVLPASHQLMNGMLSALGGGQVMSASAILSALSNGPTKTNVLTSVLAKAKASGAAGLIIATSPPAAATAAAAAAAATKRSGSSGRDRMMPNPADLCPPPDTPYVGWRGFTSASVQADDVRVLEVLTPSPMILRATAEVNSEKLGELFGGSRIFTLDAMTLRDGTVRMRVGDVGQGGRSLGWVTITSKAGIQTAYHPLSVVSAPKQILVRSGFEIKSAEVGNLEPGTRVHVLEVRATPEGIERAQIWVEGQMKPYGWATSLAKDGTRNLAPVDRAAAMQPAAAVSTAAALPRPFSPPPAEAKVPRQQALHEAANKAFQQSVGPRDLQTSNKSPPPRSQSPPNAPNGGSGGTAARSTEGGATSAAPGAPGAPGGVPAKSEAVLEAERLEANRLAELRAQQALREVEAARLEIERKAATNLDTVRAMRADLEKRLKRAEPVPDETLYERREAHRPSGRDEAKMPSRHAGIPPTVIALMFNSYRASFELVLGELKTMPDSGAYDLRSLVTHQRLGSVKIAPVKNAPLVERVEFSDQWHRADEHGRGARWPAWRGDVAAAPRLAP